MGCGVDLDVRAEYDMVTNVHFITIQDGTQDIQKDVIADVNVLAVATKEGWLDGRVLTDLS
jgi:hypothetical protein